MVKRLGFFMVFLSVEVVLIIGPVIFAKGRKGLLGPISLDPEKALPERLLLGRQEVLDELTIDGGDLVLDRPQPFATLFRHEAWVEAT